MAGIKNRLAELYTRSRCEAKTQALTSRSVTFLPASCHPADPAGCRQQGDSSTYPATSMQQLVLQPWVAGQHLVWPASPTHTRPAAAAATACLHLCSEPHARPCSQPAVTSDTTLACVQHQAHRGPRASTDDKSVMPVPASKTVRRLSSA